jgi:hypothetical protein
MKNETAIQIILRLLSSHDKLNKQCPEVIEVIESYLTIEQNQITSAWNDAFLLGRNGFILENYSNGKEYYEQLYKVTNEV